MKTMPFMGRLVKSIGRTRGWPRARPAASGPSRAMRASLTMPQNMRPPSMNARPPNICRSVTGSPAHRLEAPS
jgi:hypothetical protein